MRLLTLLSSYLAVAAAASLRKRAPIPGSLSQVTDFTAPTKAGFYIYEPKKLAASPGVIVAIHYCTGTAQAYFDNTPYATLSEEYGFIVIYPSSPHEGTCWDVSSKQTLTHEGGGDSNTIANMVKWTLSEYKADAEKVFVTGSSSGAMMTVSKCLIQKVFPIPTCLQNVLAATYPDIFKAAIVYSGVAAGCFVSNAGAIDAWNATCANGQSDATPEAWAKVVFDMYPNYDGNRPKMQIYHGGADTALLPQNYNETMKQWAGVFGYKLYLVRNYENDPQSNWTRSVYGASLEGIFAPEAGHTVPIRGSDDMKFFGFA
jgi:acetylxylan esterase